MSLEKKQSLLFSNKIRRWEMGWVDIYFEWSKTHGVTQNVQQSVNDWLNSMEGTWKGGMVDVNKISNVSAYRAVRGQGEGIAKGDYLNTKFLQEITTKNQGLIGASTADDVLVGRAQRNMLAMNLRKNLVTMYEDFDKIVNDGFSVPLRDKVNLFMEQPTYKGTIRFIDKAGKSWTPGNYASMYSRTKSSEVYNKSVMAEMSELDMDVVQVSPIATDTPICSQYVGRYYSLSGNHPTLPTLEITPPFHPNCVHDLLTVRPVDGMAEQNKKLDDKTSTDLTKSQIAGIKKGEDYIRLNRPNVYAGAVAV